MPKRNEKLSEYREQPTAPKISKPHDPSEPHGSSETTEAPESTETFETIVACEKPEPAEIPETYEPKAAIRKPNDPFYPSEEGLLVFRGTINDAKARILINTRAELNHISLISDRGTLLK